MKNLNTVKDLIQMIKERDVNVYADKVIKTVFFNGKKLFNLNSLKREKAINKLKSVGIDRKVRINYQKSRRWVGDYAYYNNRLFYMTIYID